MKFKWKKPLFTIGTMKIYLWMLLAFAIIVITTWLIAEAVTPEFSTKQYLEGFHINHSFVGVVLILLAIVSYYKKVPPVMIVTCLAIGITLIAHDGIIFRELSTVIIGGK